MHPRDRSTRLQQKVDTKSGCSLFTVNMTVTLNIEDISTDAHTRRTLSAISLSVAKGKRIVVVTGAGISCSCGIPVSMQYLGSESDFYLF